MADTFLASDSGVTSGEEAIIQLLDAGNVEGSDAIRVTATVVKRFLYDLDEIIKPRASLAARRQSLHSAKVLVQYRKRLETNMRVYCPRDCEPS